MNEKLKGLRIQVFLGTFKLENTFIDLAKDPARPSLMECTPLLHGTELLN